jgi:hypothetical protein
LQKEVAKLEKKILELRRKIAQLAEKRLDSMGTTAQGKVRLDQKTVLGSSLSVLSYLIGSHDS